MQQQPQIDSVQTPAIPDNYSFMQQTPLAAAAAAQPALATFSAQVVGPQTQTPDQNEQPTANVMPDADAQALLDKIHHDKEMADQIAQKSHERVVKTAAELAEEYRKAEQHRSEEAATAPSAPPETLHELAQSDLKISTLA